MPVNDRPVKDPGPCDVPEPPGNVDKPPKRKPGALLDAKEMQGSSVSATAHPECSSDIL